MSLNVKTLIYFITFENDFHVWERLVTHSVFIYRPLKSFAVLSVFSILKLDLFWKSHKYYLFKVPANDTNVFL